MAEAPTAAVVLRYRVGFTAMAFLMALSPVWFAWSLFALFSLLGEAGKRLSTGVTGVEFFFLPILFYFGLIVLGCLSVLVCADTALIIDRNAVRVPWQFLFAARFCLKRSWSTLKSVRMTGGDPNANSRSTTGPNDVVPQSMTLTFADGAAIVLALNGLSRSSLRDIILATQAYAPQAVFDPPLSALDIGLLGDHPGQSLHSSFTQLWEAELDNRFGSTVFVPLEPGQVLSGREPPLKILGQLSFGGLSAVYLAASLTESGAASNDRLLVLKEAVLPLGTEESLRLKAQEMFERESRLLSQLRHPRIARVLDSFVSGSRSYILLEHIEGVDLRRFVREHGPQPPAVALRWLIEAAEILAYLHEQNPPIVHRDVTPDNLVLARDGKLALIDFGAANAMLGTATGTLVGKQAYIAPEQFRGKMQCASDVYSLGATIYFALTARDPEPLTMVSPQAVRGSSTIETIEIELDRLVQDCTAQGVSERPGSMNDLLVRARAVEAGEIANRGRL